MIVIVDIFVNQLIQFCSSNTANIRSLTPRITLCVVHVIHTKWRSCHAHRLCDVTSPYVGPLYTVTIPPTAGERLVSGPDLREGANWAVAQWPQELRASTKTVKKLLSKET